MNDSVGMKCFSYDFDLESGRISNERLIVDRRTSNGEPDGMVLE
jgi:sugar lactone lactonase YvrE